MGARSPWRSASRQSNRRCAYQRQREACDPRCAPGRTRAAKRLARGAPRGRGISWRVFSSSVSWWLGHALTHPQGHTLDARAALGALGRARFGAGLKPGSGLTAWSPGPSSRSVRQINLRAQPSSGGGSLESSLVKEHTVSKQLIWSIRGITHIGRSGRLILGRRLPTSANARSSLVIQYCFGCPSQHGRDQRSTARIPGLPSRTVTIQRPRCDSKVYWFESSRRSEHSGACTGSASSKSIYSGTRVAQFSGQGRLACEQMRAGGEADGWCPAPVSQGLLHRAGALQAVRTASGERAVPAAPSA